MIKVQNILNWNPDELSNFIKLNWEIKHIISLFGICVCVFSLMTSLQQLGNFPFLWSTLDNKGLRFKLFQFVLLEERIHLLGCGDI